MKRSPLGSTKNKSNGPIDDIRTNTLKNAIVD